MEGMLDKEATSHMTSLMHFECLCSSGTDTYILPTPLRSPLRWFKWIRKVGCFKCDLTIPELHDIYYIDWTPPVICNDIFSYPVPFSPNSQDFKGKFGWVVCSEFINVVFARDSFIRLWKFNYDVVMIYVVCSVYIKSHSGLPVMIQGSTYFLIIQYLLRFYQWPRLLVLSSASTGDREW